MQRLIKWLGQGRAIALFSVIAITGVLSLMLQAVDAEVNTWVIPTQNVLLLIALVGAMVILLSRVDPIDRRPLLLSIAPLVIGFGVGIFVPPLMLWFLGAGLGWLFVSQIIIRRNVRQEYQQAIRHLRKDEYDDAITILNKLVKAEPEDTDHLRFRADLFRLKGAPQKAVQDYQRMIALEPESSVGYNGLAEVYLQQQELTLALENSQRAYELAPEHWVMPYNLGMVEDRLGRAGDGLDHLNTALTLGVPDSRHRLLIQLWRARAALRLHDSDQAGTYLAALRKEKQGLREWETIFESEQSRVLKDILADDVLLARQLVDSPDALASLTASLDKERA